MESVQESESKRQQRRGMDASGQMGRKTNILAAAVGPSFLLKPGTLQYMTDTLAPPDLGSSIMISR
eukprot:3273727-Amphidinium_carterae.1